MFRWLLLFYKFSEREIIDMAISLIDTIRNGDVKTAKKILSQHHYNNIDEQTCRNDGTALYWACSLGFLDIIQLLLLHGANVDAETEWGSTPICAASDNNNVQVVRILLKHGANVNVQTRSGDTPCHLAAYRGYAGVVQLLIEGGASYGVRNNKRHTPLDVAMNAGHTNVASYLHAVSEIFVSKELTNEKTSSKDQVELFPVFEDINVQRPPLRERAVDNYTSVAHVPYTSSSITWSDMGYHNSVCQMNSYILKNEFNDLSTSQTCQIQSVQQHLSYKNVS